MSWEEERRGRHRKIFRRPVCRLEVSRRKYHCHAPVKKEPEKAFSTQLSAGKRTVGERGEHDRHMALRKRRRRKLLAMRLAS